MNVGQDMADRATDLLDPRMGEIAGDDLQPLAIGPFADSIRMTGKGIVERDMQIGNDRQAAADKQLVERKFLAGSPWVAHEKTDQERCFPVGQEEAVVGVRESTLGRRPLDHPCAGKGQPDQLRELAEVEIHGRRRSIPGLPRHHDGSVGDAGAVTPPAARGAP